MHYKVTLLFIILSAAVIDFTNSQSLEVNEVQGIAALEKISSIPTAIAFTNSLEVNNHGGHIQGIQQLSYNQSNYFILSGSSDLYSYYAIAKTGRQNMTISVNQILQKPFKHAGGFQVYEGLMAIGVEDNDEKNKSKVFIFSMDNPEKPPEEPLAIIERMGTFKRATAGCVGITVINEKVLVVVGDWDTEHLDFYRIDHQKLYQEGATLELEYSVNSKKIDKSDWIDDRWLSYQNINFIKDDLDQLLLAGLTSNEKGDILDVFEIKSPDLRTFSLQKVYSRNFGILDQTKFRWGAGIHIHENGEISVLSTEEHIQSTSMIHSYN